MMRHVINNKYWFTSYTNYRKQDKTSHSTFTKYIRHNTSSIIGILVMRSRSRCPGTKTEGLLAALPQSTQLTNEYPIGALS